MHSAHQSAEITFMAVTQRGIIFGRATRENVFANSGRIAVDVRIIDVTRRSREDECDRVRSLNAQTVARGFGTSALRSRQHGRFKTQSPSLDWCNQPIGLRAALFP